jgi:hypothetical protein
MNRPGELLLVLLSLRFPRIANLGPDCDLNDTIAPFSEDLIRLVDLIEAKVCVGSGVKSRRLCRTSSISLRTRSLPPGQRVVTIL